jgi:hypothetical protein
MKLLSRPRSLDLHEDVAHRTIGLPTPEPFLTSVVAGSRFCVLL